MKELNRKRGPKPLNESALTAAQRKQRQRAKEACYIKAAEGKGFGVHSVLISNGQLLSLTKFWRIDDFIFNAKLGIGETEATDRKITNEAINEVIYYALNMYLDAVRERLSKEGISAELVNMCQDSNRHPADCKNLSEVETTAQELFKQWELSQLKEN